MFRASKFNPSLGRSPIVRAVVRANNDPDKKGRVRVEYLWTSEPSRGIPSEWARLSLPYASKEHGVWFLPEVGDEVLVYFENANLDHPIIIGSLYSGNHLPPSSGRGGDLNQDNKNTLNFIKTRSGHLLCFDDAPDSKGITLRDEDNRRIEIQSKEKKLLISDEQDNHIEIDGPKISIKNKQGDCIEVDSGSITIKSSGSVTVDSSNIKLGKMAMQSLVKGEMMQAFFNSHTHLSPPGVQGGPTTPPMIQMPPTVLSNSVKTS